MISLQGKIALITGGSRGIGLAIAKNFAAKGCSTILVARDAARLRDAVEVLHGLYEPAPNTPVEQLPFYTAVAGDVSQPSTWQDLNVKIGNGELGRRPAMAAGLFHPDVPDVLVNCAGIAQRSFLLRTDTDDVAAILDTNLRSAVLGCRMLARLSVRTFAQSPTRLQGSQSIINVSSVLALLGGEGAAVYAASKAGLIGLTSATALELRSRKIRVNALLPGYIESDMTKDLDKSIPGIKRLIPAGRFGTVEEVADAAAFLAQNPYANNCVLALDGGLSAGLWRG